MDNKTLPDQCSTKQVFNNNLHCIIQCVFRKPPIVPYFLVVLSLLSNHAYGQVIPTTPLGATGTTDLQIVTGDFVQTVCGGFVQNGGEAGIDPAAANAVQQSELFDKCGEMVHTANRLEGTGGPTIKDLGLTQEQLNAAIQNVATEEAAAVGSNATELATNQGQNISKRVASLLSMKGGFQLSAVNLHGGGILAADALLGGGGSAGDSAGDDGGLLSNRWSVFSNGIIGTGEKETTDAEDGFDSRHTGFTLGADYRLTPSSVVGLAVGFENASSDFITSANVAGGGLEMQSTSISSFGLWFSERWYADAILTYGTSSYDLDRHLVVQATSDAASAGNDGANTVIKSSTDSTQIAASLTGGFEHAFGGTTVAPYLRLATVNVDVDGYDEQGDSGLVFRVRDQSIESLTSAIGLRSAHAFSTGFGVLAPQFTLEYIHEFNDDSREITALYIHDPRQNELVITTDAPDRDYFTLGGAVSAILKNGWQFYADTKSVLGLDTVTAAVITLGARKEFY